MIKRNANYLPNIRSVDECLPSGGTCSRDGVTHLESSGGMMAFFVGCAVAWLMTACALRRTAVSSELTEELSPASTDAQVCTKLLNCENTSFSNHRGDHRLEPDPRASPENYSSENHWQIRVDRDRQ